MTIIAQIPPATVRRVLRDAGRGALLLPRAFRAIASAFITRTSPDRPSRIRRLGHGLLMLPLGVLALIPVAIEVDFVARGVLYALVDPGPYDHSWGGPSRAGAWTVHFLVGVPFAVAGVAVLCLLHRLAARTAPLPKGARQSQGTAKPIRA